MDLVFNVPINRVSFGQVSWNLLKAAKKAGHQVMLSPIGPVDFGTINPSDELKKWVDDAITNWAENFDPAVKGIKLWHLVTPDEHISNKPHHDRLSIDTSLISFYELDSPTKLEKQVAKNFDTVFTSNYTCEVFKEAGVKTRFMPLGFDKDNFHVTNKRYFGDDRIVFAVLGKFENRKHHQKIIQAWVKRFGNDKRYYLQLAVYNPFFNPQMNANIIGGCMGGKHYWNVNPIPWVPTNQAYNDFLNSNHIVIGMSGGEGWGLPEFHTVGLGKYGVILNAHAYKDWATEENSILVTPLDKISAVDGVFFKKDVPLNQGNIFSWNEDEFIAACELAADKYLANPVNTAGLKLQEKFTYDRALEILLKKD